MRSVTTTSVVLVSTLILLAACTGADSEGPPVSVNAFVEASGGPPADLRALELTAEVLHRAAPEAKVESVNPRAVMLQLFDPQNSVCASVLPEKVKKKLSKDGRKFAPVAVQKQIDKIPEQGTQLPNSDVALLLNTVTHRTSDGVETTIRVPSSSDFDATAFVIGNRGEFAYNLDCSGYFNAAVSVTAGVSVGDVSANAKTAIESTNSLFVARATLFPPLYAILRPGAIPEGVIGTVSDRSAMGLLLAVAAQLPNGAQPTDTLSLPTTVEAVWSSSSGQSSFNGRADFAASGAAPAGVATVSGNLKSGGSIGRSVRFTEVQAISLGTAELTGIADPNPLTVKELRDTLALTGKFTPLLSRATSTAGSYSVVVDWPSNVCRGLTWTYSVGTASSKETRPEVAKGGCEFTLPASESAGIVAAGSFNLIAAGFGTTFTRSVPVN